MSDLSAQPTIVVKKPDGTEVRMTMAEVMKMKQQSSSSVAPVMPVQEKKKSYIAKVVAPVSPPKNLPIGNVDQPALRPKKKRKKKKKAPLILPIVRRKKSSQKQEVPVAAQVKPKVSAAQTTDLQVSRTQLPVTPPPHALSTTAPVKDIFVDEAAAKQQKKNENAGVVQSPVQKVAPVQQEKNITQILPAPITPVPQPSSALQQSVAPPPPQRKKKKKKGWSIIRKKKAPARKRVLSRPVSAPQEAPPTIQPLPVSAPVPAVPQQQVPVYPTADALGGVPAMKTSTAVSSLQDQSAPSLDASQASPAPPLKAQRGTQKKAAQAFAQPPAAASAASSSVQVQGAGKPDGSEWGENDHGSLLEETLEPHESGDAKHATSPSDNGALSGVLKRIDFTVPDDLHGRLKSLVQSRLKDIRTDEQVFLYATKAVDAGGLGLADAQATKLVEVIAGGKIDPTMIAKPVPAPAPTAAKKRIQIPKPVRTPKAPVVPVTQEPQVPTAPSPEPSVKPSLPSPQPTSPAGEVPLGGGIPKTSAPPETLDPLELKAQAAAIPPVFPEIDVPPPSPGSRVAGMHDVVTPHIREPLGPVDEIATFQLEDFRRLAGDPQQAAGRFLQKFETLKNESHILYVDAVHAWHTSPLYRQYQDVLVGALEQKKPVMEVLGDGGKDAMKPEEFSEFVHLGEQLSE